MQNPERIVLVGFMGVGKTTVGRELARRLGWTFRDLDTWIEERNGCSIADIFRDRGEAFFREEELRAARDTHAVLSCVIAAGGGAFAQPATQAALKAGAVTVWLRCDIDTIVARIPPDGSRPLASDRARMQELMARREPAYRSADLTVDTSATPPEEVATRIVEALFPGRTAP